VRIGIVGYGSVAAIHADALASLGVSVAVWGPDPDRTRSFAARVTGGAAAAPDMEALVEDSDAVVVASPSPVHEAQTRRVIEAGRSVLVELPACRSASSGVRLGQLAEAHGLMLRAVHSSRVLAAFEMVSAVLRAGGIGQLQTVAYRRNVVMQHRSWTDDALWHHAQHPVDLFLSWFHEVTPERCETRWRDGARTAVAAAVGLPGGLTATIDVTYDDGPAEGLLSIIGSRGTIESDGFGWVARDGGPPVARWDATASYVESIARCDAGFLAAMRASSDEPGTSDTAAGPPWSDAIAMAAVVDGLMALERRRDA
jgi:predicted dehydrogenase